MNSPVEQFTIKTLFELNLMGVDISFTNASLFMMLSIIGSAGFLYFGARKQSLVPNRFQALVEMSYEFVANMVKENAGKVQAISPISYGSTYHFYSKRCLGGVFGGKARLGI